MFVDVASAQYLASRKKREWTMKRIYYLAATSESANEVFTTVRDAGVGINQLNIIGENIAEIKKQKLRTFRLNRFKNEVIRFSKDKRGLNITINIIEFLFLLVDGKHDKMLDKLQSLKQYNYKYLKQEQFIRPNTFIKMLLQIPKGKFEASLIREKANKYDKILEDNPMDYSEHAISIEIIPYEILWEEILTSLKQTIPKTA